jgi:acetyltransferase
MITAAEVAGAIIPVIQTASKPIVIALMGEELIAHAARLFRQSHIPDYRFPERAASALRVLVERSTQLPSLEQPAVMHDRVDATRARSILANAKPGKNGFVSPVIAARVVESYGIRIPAELSAMSEGETVEAAEKLGFPVALKVAAVDVSHKSDLGGVCLDLRTPEELIRAYRHLVSLPLSDTEGQPDPGVIVQEMAPEGQDVIVGVVRDEQFGPLVMFGTGGVEVEALKDVAFALAPLSRDEAESMLHRTWAGKRLNGYRGLPPADRERVIQALMQISELAIDLSNLLEVEINPLRVFSHGEGALALDVRMRVVP